MKGSPMYRNFGIGSPAKQAKPDVEGEKKVMDKRKKKIEDHRKNAPKPTTQEQLDQLNQMDADNVAAHNTSLDSIQGVHDAWNKHVEKQNAIIDSTNTANQNAFDKYMEENKKKSPNKQFEEGDYYDTRSKSPNKQRDLGGTKSGKGNIFTKRGRTQRKLNKYQDEQNKLRSEHIAENKRSTELAIKAHEEKMIKKQLKNRPKTVVMKGDKDVTDQYR